MSERADKETESDHPAPRPPSKTQTGRAPRKVFRIVSEQRRVPSSSIYVEVYFRYICRHKRNASPRAWLIMGHEDNVVVCSCTNGFRYLSLRPLARVIGAGQQCRQRRDGIPSTEAGRSLKRCMQHNRRTCTYGKYTHLQSPDLSVLTQHLGSMNVSTDELARAKTATKRPSYFLQNCCINTPMPPRRRSYTAVR